MAVLTRQPYKVFSQTANGDQLAQFGSMKTGTPVYSSNISTLQANSAYGEGWADAILEDKAPYLEEMNGLQYGASYQIGYLLQEGVPVYDANTTYSNTSIVKVLVNNELQFYHSLQTDNVGHDLDNTSWWAQVYFTNIGKIGQPQFTLDFADLPLNCVWLEGQAVSRTTYSTLFEIYGTTYGIGDGSTTFNLPDFRDRAIYGASSPGYVEAGLPALGGTASTAGGHNHDRGNMEIYGAFSNNGHSFGAWANGAFNNINGQGVQSNRGDANDGGWFDFYASRSWSGWTSWNGDHTHNITITGGNGLLGKSSTVLTDGIKVRVYTRYQ